MLGERFLELKVPIQELSAALYGGSEEAEWRGGAGLWRAWNSAREGLRYEQRISRDSDAHILEPLHPKTRGAR